MKKPLTYLTIALSLIIGFDINVMADPSLPQIMVSLTGEDIDIIYKNPKGISNIFGSYNMHGRLHESIDNLL